MQKQEGADMQVAQAEGVMPGDVSSAESCSNAEIIFDMLRGLSGEGHHCPESCALCLSSHCSTMTTCFLLGAGRFALTVRLINQSARKAAIKLSSTLQQAQNVHSETISYSADQLHQLQTDLGVYSTNS